MLTLKKNIKTEEQNLKLGYIKEHYQQSEKGNQWNNRKYLQIIYMIRGSYPEYIKNFVHLNNKKINLILKCTKYCNKHLSKEDTQMPNKHRKRCLLGKYKSKP